MANAPLTLRFSSDVEAAKKGVASLAVSIASNMASVAGTALSTGKTVLAAGQGIISTFQGMERAAGLVKPAVISLAAGFVAFELIKAAIAGVKQELDEMLDVATKSQERGLSPAFFQQFVSGANGVEEKIKSLEAALAAAFQATKEVLNPDWSNWNAGIENTLVKVSAVEKAMREARELFTTDQDFSGLDLFRNAKDQDSKIRAVLLYMQQLKAIGADVAALDIGEKMFGAKFADDIRSGKESVDHILQQMERGKDLHFISSENAKNAKEINDRLDEAYYLIHDKFKTDWEDLAAIALKIKSIWADIVMEVAKYKPEQSVNDADTFSRLNVRFGATSGDEFAGLDLARRSHEDISLSSPGGVVPLPRRRPYEAPKPPEDTKEKLDQIETLINLMKKANDTLQVELDTEGKSNVEREKGIALAKAEAAARAAQRDLTEDEKTKVLALAEAHATLAAKLKDVQQQLAANAENARFFGNEAATAFGNFFIDGQKANDILANLLKQWAKFAIQAAFTGQGPFASLLGFATQASSGPNAVGGLAGLISGLTNGTRSAGAASAASGFTSNDFSVFRAGGGDVQAGRAYTVGETGMEKFVPGTDGKIYPIGKGGDGGGSAINHILVDVTGATGSTEIARMVNVGMQAAYARAIADAPGAVINHQRRRG